MYLGSGSAMRVFSCSVARGVNFIAAFLGRKGRRGFLLAVDEPVDEAVDEAGFDFCASPSRTLVPKDSEGGGNSAEIEVSWPLLLRGGGKEDGRECGR